MSADGAALGSFPVVGSAAEVAAFRRATGLVADGDRLPMTFPMRWLVMPDIRAALLTLVPEPDLVLVHESQSFDVVHPLHIDRPYALHLIARREAAPDRLILDGVVADAAGVEQAKLETILRLIAAPASEAA